MKKRKILILIESLGGGGAEKVLTTIIKYINRDLFDITVCVLSGGGVYEKDITEFVNVHSVLRDASSYKGLGQIWYKIKYHMIYHWLPMWLVYLLFVPKGNDVEVAFVEGLATRLLASSSNKCAKKMAWVHCDLKNQPWPVQKGVYRDVKEEKFAYKKFDTVVCVSKQVEGVMRDCYELSSTLTIYNPIDIQEILQLSSLVCDWNVDISKFNIISVGRLEEVKGYDELIHIIGRVKGLVNDVHLWIVGSGTQKESLMNLVRKMNLEENVTFTGFIRNPYSLMAQMDLFVCSSRAEGFSLVIAEALTLGVPVVSMNCAGPRELVNIQGSGTLCDSYEDLEREIIKKYHIKSRMSCDFTSLDVRNVIRQVETLWGNV